MTPFRFVFLIVSWFCVVLETSSLMVNSGRDHGKWTIPFNTTSPKDASCYDADGNAYIDIIPNPTNCAQFYKCVRFLPDLPHVGATDQLCPADLYFDFNLCLCNYRHEAICFDQDNPEHVASRLKCACRLELNKDGEYKDDHCAQ